jgi:phage terminase large subunit-like protein
VTGSPTPRLETVYQAAGSYAELVNRWAVANLGAPLMGWQRHYLTGVLAHDPAGRLVHAQSLVSTARQNGKTYAAVALIGWYLTCSPAVLGGETPLALIVSHDLRLTTRIFEQVHAVLERTGQVARARFSFGRQDLRLHNGAELVVQADSGSAGHGYARVGLLYADELWGMSEAAWEQGLIPTTRTHPQPIILATSTAGDESSALLRRWREKGLRMVDTGRPGAFYMAEWSIPAGVDPMDEQHWGWANPALGTTLELDRLRAESDGPNRAAFLRAALNLWVAAEQAWLTPGVWDALTRPLDPPTGGVLSCEVDVDGARFVAVQAWPSSGQVQVRTRIVANTEPELWDQVRELANTDPALTFTFTPSLEHHVPPELARRARTVGYAELGRWTIPVRSAITAGQVAADPADHLLAEHVARGVLSRSEHGQALSSKRSPGPIELARCMVWAVALVQRPGIGGRPAMGRA